MVIPVVWEDDVEVEGDGQDEESGEETEKEEVKAGGRGGGEVGTRG